MIDDAIRSTDFLFPAQTDVYRGKVHDVYTIRDELMIFVTTDRISIFDVVLPRAIPCKGQVLNQLASYLLEATADIIPNWLIDVPDPAVSIGWKAHPYKLSVVVRSGLVGHAWTVYKDGGRTLCGNQLDDGLQKYDRFPKPIVTPKTKTEAGLETDITPEKIIADGLATEAEWEQMCTYALQLFARGQAMAAERGLVMSDSKYEFGKLNGKIILIDELHTPDSSRYFYTDSYESYVNGDRTSAPKHLSKEFVREWLVENGFNGKPGEAVPQMTDDFVRTISERYIELYERLTGKSFSKAKSKDRRAAIEKSVLSYLRKNL